MTQKLPVLYRKDTQGRLRVWYMQREGEKYRTFDGLEDGLHKASEWTTAKPKNVGKANQTTPERQAELEVEAQYRKQLDRKWHSTRECSDFKPPFPMLAERHDERPVNWHDPKTYGFVQPKLDGVRCLAFIHEGDITFWSREGQRHPDFPAIKDDLQAFFKMHPEVILDGELYNHDFREDFNGIVSAVKNGKKVAEAGVLQYHVYDIFGVTTLPFDPSKERDLGSFPFSARNAYLQECLPQDKGAVKLVPTFSIDHVASFDFYYDKFLKQGYEGMMFRYDGPYKVGGRSTDLLKVKTFTDDEFQLVSIEEGSGNYSGCARIAHLLTKDGKPFKADIVGGRHALRCLLQELKNSTKRITSKSAATVKFFRYTPAGIPRFGKVKAFWWNGRDL